MIPGANARIYRELDWCGTRTVSEALTNPSRVACTLSELRALGRKGEEGDGDDLASWTMKTMALPFCSSARRERRRRGQE